MSLDTKLNMCVGAAELVEGRRQYLGRVVTFVKTRKPKPVYVSLVVDAEMALANALCAAKHCVEILDDSATCDVQHD